MNNLKFLFKQYIKKPYRQRMVSIWIISAPKSGRTWIRAMLGVYISKMYGVEISKSLDLRGMTKALGLPRIDLSHNGSDFSNQIVSGDSKLANPNLWRSKKVVHVSRDIRDVLVSAFHHQSYRSNSFEGTLSEFIRGPSTGAEKIITAQKKWRHHREQASDWLDITYEQMKKNPKAVLLRVVSFVGLSEDDTVAKYAVDFCTADNMRELEKAGFFEHPSMRPSNSGGDGMKVRSAQVGKYSLFLSKADLDYIDFVISKTQN